jgi:cytochrome b pre-mRNA-processing protein 6
MVNSRSVTPADIRKQTVLRHWARIIKQWPVDKVRPTHVHFQNLMQSRVQKIQNPAAAASNVRANDAQAIPVEPFNNEKELKQINALYALLENRFEQAYPVAERYRHPRSNPTHFDTIIRELDEAPTRSWLASTWNRIKGSIRLR